MFWVFTPCAAATVGASWCCCVYAQTNSLWFIVVGSSTVASDGGGAACARVTLFYTFSTQARQAKRVSERVTERERDREGDDTLLYLSAIIIKQLSSFNVAQHSCRRPHDCCQCCCCSTSSANIDPNQGNIGETPLYLFQFAPNLLLPCFDFLMSACLHQLISSSGPSSQWKASSQCSCWLKMQIAVMSRVARVSFV